MEMVSKPKCWGEVGCIKEDFVLPGFVNQSKCFLSLCYLATFGFLEASHIFALKK